MSDEFKMGEDPIDGQGHLFWSLDDARDWLRERVIDDGEHCPCCGQFAKVYKRKLNSTMAASLIWLVNEWESLGDPDEYIHMMSDAPKWVVKTNQVVTIGHWKLIETKPRGKDQTGKSSGFWRPTDSGVQFAKGAIEVPSHVYLYDGVPVRWQESKIAIREALGSHFNYDEMIAGRYTDAE